MTFGDYWDGLSSEEKKRLAQRVDSSVHYLFQIAKGYRKAGPEFAKRIELHAGIKKEAIRPDIWE